MIYINDNEEIHMKLILFDLPPDACTRPVGTPTALSVA
jgi:hypothetical protein